MRTWMHGMERYLADATLRRLIIISIQHSGVQCCYGMLGTSRSRARALLATVKELELGGGSEEVATTEVGGRTPTQCTCHSPTHMQSCLRCHVCSSLDSLTWHGRCMAHALRCGTSCGPWSVRWDTTRQMVRACIRTHTHPGDPR